MQNALTIRMTRRALAVGLSSAISLGALGCDADDGPDDAGMGTGGPGDADDDAGDNDTDGSSVDSSGGETQTPEGFHVFPLYMLVDVPAIVTVEEEDAPAQPCVFDDDNRGYLCDTLGFATSTATIRVERDGFEPAAESLPIVPATVEPVEVHLEIETASTGAWSDCALVEDFGSCDAVCGATALVCAPASCASEDKEEPLARLESFAELECAGLPQASTPGCSEDLPSIEQGLISLRCCCAE